VTSAHNQHGEKKPYLSIFRNVDSRLVDTIALTG
jgi:hypothetical protein